MVGFIVSGGAGVRYQMLLKTKYPMFPAASTAPTFVIVSSRSC